MIVPCFLAQDMIDGAAFLGVGFDARGKYSPESRKISIVQRKCANDGTYVRLRFPLHLGSPLQFVPDIPLDNFLQSIFSK